MKPYTILVIITLFSLVTLASCNGDEKKPCNTARKKIIEQEIIRMAEMSSSDTLTNCRISSFYIRNCNRGFVAYGIDNIDTLKLQSLVKELTTINSYCNAPQDGLTVCPDSVGRTVLNLKENKCIYCFSKVPEDRKLSEVLHPISGCAQIKF